jgi:hypothetical protein
MKVSQTFSTHIQSKRVQQADLMDWKEAKKLFVMINKPLFMAI